MFQEVVRTARVWQAGGGCTLNSSPSRTDNMHANATLALMRRHPEKFQTITSDNGTEFHGYAQIEAASPVKFYFATPHHSWERGTDENTSIRIALRTARMGSSVQKCWLTPDSLLDR